MTAPEWCREIDVTEDLTLIVGQLSKSPRVHAYRFVISVDVADALRDACTATLARLNDLDPLAYESDIALDSSVNYLTVANESTAVHREERGKPGSDGVAHPVRIQTNAMVRQTAALAATLPRLNPRDLQATTFAFYAAVVGDDPDRRVTFVSRANPYRAALAGGILTTYGDHLQRITGSVFVFGNTFDAILGPEQIVAFDVDNFESLFRDVDILRSQIPTWSNHVIAALPITDSTAELIQNACLRNSFFARSARSLQESGTLTGRTLDLSPLVAELAKWGVDCSGSVQDGKLDLQQDQVATLFKVLDEKLYEGWRTGTHWQTGTRQRLL